MKKNILLLLCLFITFAVLAQKQQGLVRTIERPGQKSVGIKGATVKINEYPNALVSGKGGKFSFAIQGKKQGDRCLVTRVEKKGYTLIDKMPTFAYSISTPVEIVMVSNKQLQQDEQRIRGKAEKKAAAIYEKRIAELERQLNEKTISEEQYREQLQQVFDGHENFLKMINEMARRYAMTDYKGISEINRQIQECIENAELERADSLINSKGDINQRNQELQNKKETTQKLAELHKQALEDYETSLNDLAQDYYNKHLICAAKYQNDSAAYWLEQRATLDTSNVIWQINAGCFVSNYLANYPLALKYCLRAKLLIEKQYDEQSEIAFRVFNDIGVVYFHQGNYKMALEYYLKASNINNESIYSEELIRNHWHNIGIVYSDLGEYDKALDYLFKVIDAEKEILDNNNNKSIAETLINIGTVFAHKNNYDKAFEYFQKAYETIGNDQDTPLLGKIYNNLALCYDYQNNDTKAFEFHQKALETRKKSLVSFHPDIARSYNNIGIIYAKKNMYDTAMVYFQKSVDILAVALSSYNDELANNYFNIATIYYHLKENEKALEYHLKALEIREKNLGKTHKDVASSLNGIGLVYDKLGHPEKAMDCYQQALEIWRQYQGDSRNGIANVLCNIGVLYYHQREYELSVKYYQEALEIYDAIGSSNSTIVRNSIINAQRQLDKIAKPQ